MMLFWAILNWCVALFNVWWACLFDLPHHFVGFAILQLVIALVQVVLGVLAFESWRRR